MPEYEQTGTIMAEPDALFDYLAEVRNLPEYLPILTEAEAAGPDLAVVTTDIHGDEQHTEGWLHIDGLERRMEWGTREGYNGWLQVEPDDAGTGSVVTIHLAQDHDSDADDDLIETLDNIRRLAEAGEI